MFVIVTVVIFMITSITTVDVAEAGATCRTPNGTAGKCTPLTECLPLLDILRSPSITAKQKNHVSRSGCGSFNRRIPVVCCPVVVRHRNLGLINAKACGNVVTDRLYRGKDAGYLEFPWTAILLYKRNGKLTAGCSGSLISRKYVLTSSYCVAQTKPTRVRLGDHDLRTNPDCEKLFIGTDCYPPVQDIAVKRVVTHPGYNPTSRDNDVALIELRTHASVQRTPEDVNTICLPLNEILHEGRHLAVAGWGFTDKGPVTRTLQRMTVTVMPAQQCPQPRSPNLTENQLCVGTRETYCVADAGAAVMAFPEASVQQTLYGLVSHGDARCAAIGRPVVYTRISGYITWILDMLTP